MTAVSDLLDRAPVLQSVSADLRRNTWTFAMPERLPVRAGEYTLVPVGELREAVQADAARVCASIQASSAPRRVRFGCGGGFRTFDVSTPDDSFDVHMQQEILPDRAEARGVWYGSMTMRDASGVAWSRSFRNMLMDDFGDLVEVPECS
jgi:hypothetical protein